MSSSPPPQPGKGLGEGIEKGRGSHLLGEGVEDMASSTLLPRPFLGWDRGRGNGFLDTFPQFKSLLDHMNAKRVSEGKDHKGATSGLAHGLQDFEDRKRDGYEDDSHPNIRRWKPPFEGTRPPRLPPTVANGCANSSTTPKLAQNF